MRRNRCTHLSSVVGLCHSSIKGALCDGVAHGVTVARMGDTRAPCVVHPCSPSLYVGAIAKVILQSVAGAQIVDVCAFGDQFILQETDQVFKNKKDIKKGTWTGVVYVVHGTGNGTGGFILLADRL